MVFAASQCTSFEEASTSLRELADLQLFSKRIWRAAKRVGEERVAERRAAALWYEALPLPKQRENPGVQTPHVACVQMDGGRFQVREPQATDALAGKLGDASEENGWREYKAGVLMSMMSKTHTEDPCPELPATFHDPGKMRQIAREIKGFTHESPVSLLAEEATDATAHEREGRPEMLVKSVVATSGNVEAFGPLLASAAYERGFHAAPRKAFVADGSSTNWSVWRRYFSHYTPILDFVHALMYVYAAAMAGRRADEGWLSYHDWASRLWKGEVDQLLAAIERRQQELGIPDKKETDTPRAQVASSLGYLTNQRERMKYAEYRQKGLPITSSPIESTIKQINRRIKGTEKFWSEGADPILHLVADRLSQTNAVDKFWERRTQTLIEQSRYQLAG